MGCCGQKRQAIVARPKTYAVLRYLGPITREITGPSGTKYTFTSHRGTAEIGSRDVPFFLATGMFEVVDDQ